jgi:hypothetical protein
MEIGQDLVVQHVEHSSYATKVSFIAVSGSIGTWLTINFPAGRECTIKPGDRFTMTIDKIV